MFTLNNVFVVGNLAKDVEIFNDGKLAKITLATNRYIGKDTDGKSKTETAFIKVIVFNGKINAIKDLKKGDSLGVEGYLQNASYEKDGVKHNYYELVAQDLLLGQKMSNKNSVEVAGNLVENPELKYTTNNKAFAKVRLACNRYAGKDDKGNIKTEVLFIDVTLFGKQAEVVAQHSLKGDTIYVSGVIRVRSYESQDGQKRIATDILANRVQFVTTKKANIPTDASYTSNELNDDEIPF